jgi:hypothetical protein
VKSKEDVESYLMRMGVPYADTGNATWVISGADGVENMIIAFRDPVLVFRVKVLPLPKDDKQKVELYETVLGFNAKEMVHGAYGIEGESLVITDALQLENLDFNEFQATVDDITLAVADHYTRLSKFRAAA